MSEKLELESCTGNIVCSSLESKCKACFISCNIDSEIFNRCLMQLGKRRRGINKFEHGTIYLCSGDEDDIKSSKLFKKKLSIYEASLSTISQATEETKQKINKQTEVLLHNIISLNAHNIQEVHAVMPYNHTNTYKGAMSKARVLIKKDPHEFANAMYRINKNNMAMKMEFSVFNRLMGADKDLPMRNHEVKRVFLSILHSFFQDFNDKNVYINMVGDDFEVNIDYESMHVVFHHILENTVKYCYPKEEITIMFCSKNNQMIFQMYSLEITEEDMKHIFQEGYSGAYAQLAGKSGKGIGLSRVQKLLQHNNASIKINNNIPGFINKVKKEVSYQRNNITITFS